MYQLETKPIGIFASTLEFRWFVRFRQYSKVVQYVGHVERWRDFVVNGVSVEIKPQFEQLDDLGLASHCWQRVPGNCQNLVVVIGDPSSYKTLRVCKKTSVEFDVQRCSELFNGVI